MMRAHDIWRSRDSVIGRKVWSGGWKVIADIEPSRMRNAYTIVFQDGSTMELCSYDDIEVR